MYNYDVFAQNECWLSCNGDVIPPCKCGNTRTLDSSVFENKRNVLVKSRQHQGEFWSRLGLPQRGSQSQSTKMSWSTIVQCKEFNWMLDGFPKGTSSFCLPHQSPGECVSLAVAAFCRFIKATAQKSACV